MQVHLALVHIVNDKGEIHVLLFSFFPALVVFNALSTTERDTTQYYNSVYMGDC